MGTKIAASASMFGIGLGGRGFFASGDDPIPPIGPKALEPLSQRTTYGTQALLDRFSRDVRPEVRSLLGEGMGGSLHTRTDV